MPASAAEADIARPISTYRACVAHQAAQSLAMWVGIVASSTPYTSIDWYGLLQAARPQ